LAWLASVFVCVAVAAMGAPPAYGAGGTISTIAGNGTAGYTGDSGAATSAELSDPHGVGVDSSGDLVIAGYSNQAVRLVAAASCSSGCPYGLASMTKGDIYTVAGNGIGGFSGDSGAATSAELNFPIGVGVDSSGDLLIADYINNRVRLVAAASCSSGCPYGLSSMTKGDIYTIAGNGTAGFSGDSGAATSAELNGPDGVAVDSSGDLLIADPFNNRVRLVAAASCSSGCPYGLASMTKGDIYTIAGNGTQGYSGDSAAATSAEVNRPAGVGVDASGDMLIGDVSNQRVRLVAAASCSSGCPYGLASMTKGDIYTVAGNGTGGFSGDMGAATSAKVQNPGGVGVDSSGDLLIADVFNQRVRLVAAASCFSGCPYGLASMTKGDIYTIAGNGTAGFSGDSGAATSAELHLPVGVAVESGGDLVIVDSLNNVLRLVTVGASPSLSMSVPSSGTAGSQISASSISAALSGGEASPAGTISFKVFGPQSSAPSSCGSGGTTVGTASVSGNGTYHSSAGFAPSIPGNYWWYASYGGDANNAAASSTCGTAMAETVVPDTGPPSISITSPANGARYTQGQVVKASYSCTDPDGAADVASCAGPVAPGSPIVTSITGAHSFTVHAADRAGKGASQTVSYTVAASGGGTPRIITSGRRSTKTHGAHVVVDPGIKVFCPAGGQPCTGNETATATLPASVGKSKKVIGRVHFTILAGRSSELRFKLTSKGARLLRKLKILRVKVTVVCRVDHNPSISATTTISIKAPPRRHHH
jgi:hypothetical protein